MTRLKLTILFAVILVSSMIHSLGATYFVTSVSYSDVSTAVRICSNGDTLMLPAGSAFWVHPLDITKSINLIGIGTNQTIIYSYGTFITTGTNIVNVTGISFRRPIEPPVIVPPAVKKIQPTTQQ